MNWLAFSLDTPCLQRLVLKIGIIVKSLLFSTCINCSILLFFTQMKLIKGKSSKHVHVFQSRCKTPEESDNCFYTLFFFFL